jgi:hypothetical protein
VDELLVGDCRPDLMSQGVGVLRTVNDSVALVSYRLDMALVCVAAVVEVIADALPLDLPCQPKVGRQVDEDIEAHA